MFTRVKESLDSVLCFLEKINFDSKEDEIYCISNHKHCSGYYDPNINFPGLMDLLTELYNKKTYNSIVLYTLLSYNNNYSIYSLIFFSELYLIFIKDNQVISDNMINIILSKLYYHLPKISNTYNIYSDLRSIDNNMSMEFRIRILKDFGYDYTFISELYLLWMRAKRYVGKGVQC